MHHKTLSSAVAKYLPITGEEARLEAIRADEKGYTDEEVQEILSAIAQALEPTTLTQSDGKTKSIRGTLNKTYEEWKVKPLYKDVLDYNDKVVGRKLIGFEKDAQKAIRVTSITPDKAEILNSQSENTLLRLYEVK